MMNKSEYLIFVLAPIIEIELPINFDILSLLSHPEFPQKLRNAHENNRFVEFNLNQPLFDGKTFLHEAIELGLEKAVKALLDAGATMHAHYILSKEFNEVSFSPFLWAAARGEMNCFDLLASKRQASFQEEAQGIGNLLHVTIQFGQLDMLEHLLDKHFDHTQKLLERVNANDQTPLMLAASIGNLRAISILYERGASLETENSDKRTALHAAALENQIHAIQLLLYFGAKITAKDVERKKAIDLVKDEETRSFLIETSMPKQRNLPPRCGIIKNLVFQGGYAFTYLGAIAILEKERALQKIERVAGISDQGALLATLISLGYNSTEVPPLPNFSNFSGSPEEDVLQYPQYHSLLAQFRLLNENLDLPELLGLIKKLWLNESIFNKTTFREWSLTP